MLKTQSSKTGTGLVENEIHFAKIRADFEIPDFKPKANMVYTRVRAISARVNRNFDGFRSSELKSAYQTFAGRPVFVNHENHDPSKTRGMIIAPRYCEAGNDKFIELFIEVDAKAFPKLAEEIVKGNLDSVSMGCDVQETECSYCGNVAGDTNDFCDHILYSKGQTLSRLGSNGMLEDVVVYEDCRKISFFEISFVFDPADETALAQEVIIPRMAARKLAYGERSAPAEVDTMREEEVCPECGADDFGGDECKWCEYRKPPEQLEDPDLEEAKETDLRQEDEEDEKSDSEDTEKRKETRMTRKPSLGRALTNRRLSQAKSRIADMSVNEQPHDDEEQEVSTPAPEAGISTEQVMNEGTDTDVTNIDQTAVPVDFAPDQQIDVEKSEGEIGNSSPSTAKVHPVVARRRAAIARRKLTASTADDFRSWVGGSPESLGGDEFSEKFKQFCSEKGIEWSSSLANSVSDEIDDSYTSSRRKRADSLTEGDGEGVGQDGDGFEGSDAATAEPEQRVDVEAPTANTTDDRAQDSQFDSNAYDNQAMKVEDPDLTTDQNWVPGSGPQPSKNFESKVKASSMSAMILAESYVEHGLIEAGQRMAKFAEFEKLPQAVVSDRTALLESVKTVSKTQRVANRATVPRSVQGGRRQTPAFGRAVESSTTPSDGSDTTLLLV